MRILVTGSSGTLGHRLTSNLIANGHELVALLSGEHAVSRANFATTNFNLDVDVLKRFIDQHSTQIIIHAATLQEENGTNLDKQVFTNVLLPTRLLMAAILSGRKILFINIDTVLEKFTNQYSLTKSHFQEIGQAVAAKNQLSFVNLKLQTFYGPVNTTNNIINRLVSAAVSQQQSFELTTGLQKRDFIHIDDVISAISFIVGAHEDMPNGFHSIDLGSGQLISIKELATWIKSIAGSSIKLNFGGIPSGKYDKTLPHADVRALNSLGWYSKYTLEKGLNEVINFEKSK